MSLLSRLFGGGASKPKVEAVMHKDFSITPDPMKDGGEFRIAAIIEKEVGGQMKSHRLIRADVLNDYQAACDASVDKAKVMIDQMGEGLFG
jgi:hypothetical protein